MKKEIAWHQECLTNIQSTLNRRKEEYERLKQRYESEINQLEEDVSFYDYQIHEAIRKNKDGFDSDLFLKKLRDN